MCLAKKNTVETKVWLDKDYSDFAPAKSTVEKWFAKFKPGEMSTKIFWKLIINFSMKITN